MKAVPAVSNFIFGLSRTELDPLIARKEWVREPKIRLQRAFKNLLVSQLPDYDLKSFAGHFLRVSKNPKI